MLYKYVDDQGGYLAALLTYYGFVSLFPLLLLASTVLGFVLRGDQPLQQQLLHSALSQFPVIGKQLEQPARIGGGLFGLVVGVLGSLYGSLGVAQALQNAMNIAWAVPRNSRPNPIKSRGRGLLLLTTAGLAILATAVLSAVGSSVGGSWSDPGTAVVRGLVILGSVAVNSCAFVLAFRIATARDLSVRDVAPGRDRRGRWSGSCCRPSAPRMSPGSCTTPATSTACSRSSSGCSRSCTWPASR